MATKPRRDRAEKESLRIRAELLEHIRRITEDRSMNQVEAAELFGIGRNRFNPLLHGHIERFSIDALVKMLARAGVRLSLVVKKRK